jgi:hypothetical protein
MASNILSTWAEGGPQQTQAGSVAISFIVAAGPIMNDENVLIEPGGSRQRADWIC